MILCRCLMIGILAGFAVAITGCKPTIESEVGTVYQEIAEESPEQAIDAAPAVKAIEMGFDELNLNLKLDDVVKPEMLSAVMPFDGKRISLKGVMHGGVPRPRDLDFFILLRNQESYRGPGFRADELVEVRMKTGHTMDYTNETVRVEGALRIDPQTGADGNTWSIYTLEDATVAVVR